MIGVIPAAGKGTRMGTLTDNRPKAMIEVAGHPLVDHAIDIVRRCGIDDIVIVTGYMSDMIEDRVAAYEGVTTVEQSEPKGIADAIWQTNVDDDILVYLGDTVMDSAPKEAVGTLDHADGIVVVETVALSQAKKYGVVEMDSNGSIDRMIEKPSDPSSTLVDTGLYVLPAEFMDVDIEPSVNGEYEIQSAINALIDDGMRFVPYQLLGERVNVNTPADLLRADKLFR